MPIVQSLVIQKKEMAYSQHTVHFFINDAQYRAFEYLEFKLHRILISPKYTIFFFFKKMNKCVSCLLIL